MYARVATFEGGDPSRVAQAIEANRQAIRQGRESPPPGLEGVREVWMLVDREGGRGLGITIFDDEEALRRGDEALNEMTPPGAGEGGPRRTSVAFYEVAIREAMS